MLPLGDEVGGEGGADGLGKEEAENRKGGYQAVLGGGELEHIPHVVGQELEHDDQGVLVADEGEDGRPQGTRPHHGPVRHAPAPVGPFPNGFTSDSKGGWAGRGGRLPALDEALLLDRDTALLGGLVGPEWQPEDGDHDGDEAGQVEDGRPSLEDVLPGAEVAGRGQDEQSA